MSLLVLPGRVEASLAVPEGVLMTRVVVGQGIHLVELVTGPFGGISDWAQLGAYKDGCLWGWCINEQACIFIPNGVTLYGVNGYLCF